MSEPSNEAEQKIVDTAYRRYMLDATFHAQVNRAVLATEHGWPYSVRSKRERSAATLAAAVALYLVGSE